MSDPLARYSAQEALNAEVLPGDATMVTVTAYQATKIAGIVGAAAQGPAASKALAAISKFLHAVSIEARGARVKPSSGKHWHKVDSYIPPPLGGPNRQTA